MPPFTEKSEYFIHPGMDIALEETVGWFVQNYDKARTGKIL
jgi:hypothetical protein